jgi:uncharacterized protein YyaL (SSP411 family)
MPNHLAAETSPYLLQHKNNPVDWYPWGPEALAASKAQEKPIFLSIGYSACHWCHVMEHESFENEAIAAILNEKFINIKVDREERPDLDQIYMNAVQMMTGRGGWPMSVFLTPDLKPFYAGTYFPPTARGGMPGFPDVLRAVDQAWHQRRDQAEKMAEQLTEELNRLDRTQAGPVSEQMLENATAQLAKSFDTRWGGFGAAPKFPHAMDLQLLLRRWFRTGDQPSMTMVRTTLDRMAAGGIYDHLGGGFARYSVDERWLVPHFEKMLYDNALLATAYVEAYQATGHAPYEQTVRETLDYVLRDMTDEQGGFYSAEDADSEGEEGKFYVWTPRQLREVLSPEAAATFAKVYDVTEAGNFEHKNILNLPRPMADVAAELGRDVQELRQELAASRAKLFAAREARVHPAKDDKVLVNWNGLMIDAMARAGAALGEERYLNAATKAARFLLGNLRREDGRLLHTWRQGTAKLDAYLDDYAALANGLVSLYEATFDETLVAQACQLVDQVLAHFAAPDGGFYFTADDHEQLISRQRDIVDNAIPSGNSLMATVAVRLGKLTGNAAYLAAAEGTLKLAADMLRRGPTAMGQMLMALDWHIGPVYEMVLARSAKAPQANELVELVQRRFLPHKLLACIDPADSVAEDSPLTGLLEWKRLVDDEPTLYVCEGFVCQEPVHGVAAITDTVDALTRKS